ncbi:MAG: hypothetical protein ACI4QD_03170 [Kiritimatiellia bacterium]
MRFLKFCLSVLLVFVSQRLAGETVHPLSLAIDLPQVDYILGEPIPVEVTILNQSTERAVFGVAGSSDNLVLELRHAQNKRQLAPVGSARLFTKPTTIMPGQTYATSVNLLDFAQIEGGAKYILSAVLISGSVQYTTKPLAVSVVPGIPLKTGTQLFATAAGLQRVFTLVYWPRNRMEELFLRIEDPKRNKRWATIPLGTVLRHAPPKIDISPEGEVSILHRSTQYHYNRTLLWSLPNEILIRSRDRIRDPDNAMAARISNLEPDIRAIAEKNLPEDERRKLPENRATKKYLPPRHQEQ